MQVKYIIVVLLLVLVAGSVWLLGSKAPKQGLSRTLFLLARVCVVAGWLIIFSACVYFAFFFSLVGGTKDEVSLQSASPNGRYVVAVVRSYGGAAISNSTRILIRSGGERFSIKKNSIIFSKYETAPVGVSWDGDEHLIIRSGPGEVYLQTVKWNGLNITYLPDDNK
jgi:hypothetical protein